jgi:hypothetical protein
MAEATSAACALPTACSTVVLHCHSPSPMPASRIRWRASPGRPGSATPGVAEKV